MLPATLAAAIAAEAWTTIAPLQQMPWLGRLLAAAQLPERGKSRWHFPCLHDGLKAIPRERRQPRGAVGRAARGDHRRGPSRPDHDHWLNQRTRLARKLVGRRSNSRLPATHDYVLTRPIVSAGMIADELGITPRAAQNMVAELGMREATGRER